MLSAGASWSAGSEWEWQHPDPCNADRCAARSSSTITVVPNPNLIPSTPSFVSLPLFQLLPRSADAENCVGRAAMLHSLFGLSQSLSSFPPLSTPDRQGMV